jgi:hypothetical protein
MQLSCIFLGLTKGLFYTIFSLFFSVTTLKIPSFLNSLFTQTSEPAVVKIAKQVIVERIDFGAFRITIQNKFSWIFFAESMVGLMLNEFSGQFENCGNEVLDTINKVDTTQLYYYTKACKLVIENPEVLESKKDPYRMNAACAFVLICVILGDFSLEDEVVFGKLIAEISI